MINFIAVVSIVLAWVAGFKDANIMSIPILAVGLFSKLSLYGYNYVMAHLDHNKLGSPFFFFICTYFLSFSFIALNYGIGRVLSWTFS